MDQQPSNRDEAAFLEMAAEVLGTLRELLDLTERALVAVSAGDRVELERIHHAVSAGLDAMS